jgi:pimeloyl-ACP methyl ester carboxylesterase
MRTTLALGLALSLSGCGAGSAPAERASAATIELGPCPALADAKCGVLEVEENRDAPSGRTIGLSILVIPSRSRTPAPDPVFLLAGGPGQGAAALAPMIAHKFDPILRDRDMVFVDVRGTGSSGPLACELEDPDDLAQLLGDTLDVSKLDACLANYDELYDGVDLTRYTTVEMADDLDEVRAALGYEQANLFGISYGTRLGQVWMRRHGEHVRSAVFDGVVPLDAVIALQMPTNNEAALERVLADCREDPECAAAFPGLERKLAAVLTDLETNRALEELDHPRTGERVRVDVTRVGFIHALGGALYSAGLTSLVPLAIERAHAGDFGPVAALALRMSKTSKTLSMGMHLSVMCAEDLAAYDEAAVAAATAELELFDGHVLGLLDEACARWPHAELGSGWREPLESDVPTLLLSGRYDPVTPPAFAERVAAPLTDARHVVVDAVSHGVWHSGCAPRLIAGFFADPDPAAVDASCFDTLARTAMFLTPNGPLPTPRGETGALDEARATELAQGQLVHRERSP